MSWRDAIAKFLTVRGPQASTPGYVYHATNADRARDIAEMGALRRHRPHEFTDQQVWPDGSTERRNYFTPTAEHTWQFAPEEGNPVLLRMQREGHPIRSESGTGDLYSTKDVPAKRLEALIEGGEGGSWTPLHKDILGALLLAAPTLGAFTKQDDYEAPR